VRSFVDTNVLVYAEDRDAGAKHEIARDLLVDLWNTRQGVVSVQVLQEFYVTITRKPKRPLHPLKALEIVREYLTWHVVENTSNLLVASIHLHQKAKLSFWDGAVVQAAIEAGCSRLYTEDLNAGQRFGALMIENPFEHR
jgi:predicted nucleic acid-binding protein